MAFKEENFAKPTRHNPYLHEIVIREITKGPKGRLLDLPSGPGYLVQDLQKLGFSGVAAEIDPSLHCLDDVEYCQVDMTKRFPFPDAHFDYVTSIEGVEHIDNHVAFFKEVRRVLKPGGKLYLTTPNVLSLISRWNFFLSGFHDLAAKPIPLDTENIYFEHINPISLNQIYFYCEKSGLRLEHLTTHRLRSGSRLFYLLFYPFIKLAIYRACFVKERDPKRREQNRNLYQFLSSPENLLGSHTVVTARAF